MPNVNKLPSGRFRARAYNPAKPGTLKYETVQNPAAGSRGTWPDWESAHAAALRREGEIDGTYESAGLPVLRQRKRCLFAPYATAWVATRSGAPNTVAHEESHVRMLNKFFGEMDGADVVKDDVLRYLREDRDRGIKAVTRYQRLAILRLIFDKMIDEGIRTKNPTKSISVKLPPRSVSKARKISDQELYLAQAFMPDWLYPMCFLAYDSGLREAEIAGLTWQRLDLRDPHNAWVVVQDVMERDKASTIRDFTKGGTIDEVPITYRTAVALIRLRKKYPAADTDHVFRRPIPKLKTFKPVTPQYIGDNWRMARKKAGLDAPAVKFHDLRHCCATNLARAGYSAMVIKAVLRHANLSTSQGYIEAANKEEVRSALSAVATGAGKRHLRAVPDAGTAVTTVVEDEARKILNGIDLDALSVEQRAALRALLSDPAPTLAVAGA